MTPSRRYRARQQQATQRRLQKARERLPREQARAQRDRQALEHAIRELGLPETVVEEVEWRLQAQGKLLSQIVGVMCPPLCGCRTASERSRGRGWDKHCPTRLLGALPKRTWVQRLQQLGRGLLGRLWRHVADKSPATRSRWQWTWVSDDRVFKKAGHQVGVGGTWDSGQEHRVRLGIEGLRLVVVIGDGQLVVPVDLVVRRPDPVGPGRPCDDQLTWLRVMLDRTWAALRRQCRHLPVPLVVAASWCGDSQWLAHVATPQPGRLLVEGKRVSVFQLPDGRRVTGQDLWTRHEWPWRDSPQAPGVRYVRLMATSPPSGAVTVIIVDNPGRDRVSLCCRATTCAAPRLIRAWGRRSWMEHQFRTLKHLWATEACQVQGDDAYYAPLVLRLMAGLVLLYTARVLFTGRVTMEAIVFSLQQHWRFVDSAPLELHARSWALDPEAA
jgi:hypothetical protein